MREAVGVAEPLAHDLTGMPSVMRRLPWVWLKSWNRSGGVSALATACPSVGTWDHSKRGAGASQSWAQRPIMSMRGLWP